MKHLAFPTPLFKSLARHFWFRTTYFALTDPIPAKLRQQLGRRDAVLRDSAEPPHNVRWIEDDRLLVSGADGDAARPSMRFLLAALLLHLQRFHPLRAVRLLALLGVPLIPLGFFVAVLWQAGRL